MTLSLYTSHWDRGGVVQYVVAATLIEPTGASSPDYVNMGLARDAVPKLEIPWVCGYYEQEA